MALPQYDAVLKDPKFSTADVSRQRQINDAYWNAYDKENPSDEWAKGMREDSTRALDAKAKLTSASSMESRAYQLEKDASNARLKLRQADKLGLWESPEQRNAFVAENDTALAERRDALKKTQSLFTPEVNKEMQPAWNALETSARNAGVFGSPTVDGDAEKSRANYEQYRARLADDFKLTTEEVDDLVKHRIGAQKDPVSRDVAGVVHIKDDILSKGPDEVVKAIAGSSLPDAVKSKFTPEEVTDRVNRYQSNIVELVKNQHPELAADIKFTGEPAKDFAEITGRLNGGAWSQFGGGVGAYAAKRAAAVAGAPGLSPGLMVTPSMAVTPPNEQFRQAGEDVAKRMESINQLSHQINKEKVELWGTDAAVIGSGVGSVAESVALGALTGGLGTALISADRIAKAGKAGKVLLGFTQRAANVAPIGGLYGAEQAFGTYEQALKAGKSQTDALKFAATDGAIEMFTTMLFSGVKIGGTEDLGQRLTTAAARETMKKSIGTAILSFGKAVVGENLEELSINALSTVAVQAKLNPQMTVEEFKQSLKDTMLATTLSSAPLSAVTSAAEVLTPTHEQDNNTLRDTADRLYIEAATQENLSSLENAGGTDTPPGASVVAGGTAMTRAELEDARQERIAELEEAKASGKPFFDAEELEQLKTASLEDIAKDRAVDLVEEVPNDEQDSQKKADPSQVPLPPLPTGTPPPAGPLAAGGTPQGTGPAQTQGQGEVASSPSRSQTPSQTLPPKAKENVEPRPPEGGGKEGRSARIAWDDTHQFTHNPDGTPIQPTLLDETVQAVQQAGKLTGDDAQLGSIGTMDVAGTGTAIKQLLDNGWNWNGERMVNPANPSETPLQGLQRIRAERTQGSTPAAAQERTPEQIAEEGKALLAERENKAPAANNSPAPTGTPTESLPTDTSPTSRDGGATFTKDQPVTVTFENGSTGTGKVVEVLPNGKYEVVADGSSNVMVKSANELAPAEAPVDADLVVLTDAVLEAMGITREEAAEMEAGAAPDSPQLVQGLLFQNPEAEGDPAAINYVRSFKGAPPSGATRAILDYAGDPLLAKGDLGDLPKSTVRDIQKADQLIQEMTRGVKRKGIWVGVTNVGRIGFNSFLGTLWRRNNRGAKPGWANFRERRSIRKLAKILSFEVAHALTKDGSGKDWYRAKVEQMYSQLSKEFPELADPNGKDRFFFSVILAATSNGQDVLSNMEDTLRIYREMRGSGTLPNKVTIKRSSRKGPVNESIRSVRFLIAELGWKGAKEFMLKPITVSDLKKDHGIDLSGELADHKVIGAMTMGPKIGSFWGNLNGHYESITMDLWFTRSMNRLSGDNATINHTKLADLLEELAQMEGVPSDVKKEIKDYTKAARDGEGASWTKISSDIREEVDVLYDYLKATYAKYSKDFAVEERTPLNRKIKTILGVLDGGSESPGNGSHRAWMREVVETAQADLRKNGVNITNADFQAILWFHEKDLYTRFGATSGRGGRMDYAQAVDIAIKKEKLRKTDATDTPDLQDAPVDPDAPAPTQDSREVQQTLFQNQDTPKGQVTFTGLAKALIEYFGKADGSTAVHEPLHIARRFLLNRNIPQDRRVGITDEMIDAANSFVGATSSNWNVEQEEKFARAFERYLWEGATTGIEAVDQLLAKIAQFMQGVYKNIQGSSLDVELTPEIRQLFDSLITRGETLKKQGVAPTPVKIDIKVNGKSATPKPATPKPAARKPAAKKLPPRAAKRETENPDDFALRKSQTNAIRAEYGFPESGLGVSMTDQEAWDEALARVAYADRYSKMTPEQQEKAASPALVGPRLVQDLIDNPRTTDKVEKALLAHEGLVRERAIDAARVATKKLPNTATAAERADVATKLQQALENFEELLNVVRLQGSRAGLALQAMKLVVNRSFEVSKMLADALAAKNDGSKFRKQLTPEEISAVEKLAEEIKEKVKLREELESEKQKAELAAEENSLLKKMVASLESRVKKQAPRGVRSESFISSIKEKAEAARPLLSRFARKLSQMPEQSAAGRRHAELEARNDAEYLAAVEAGDMKTAQRMVDEAVKAAAVELPQSYQNAPDSLLGFKASNPNTPYAESKYKVEITVVVGNGPNAFVDSMKGLNVPHAMERARRNWETESVRFAGRGKPDPVTRDIKGNVIPLSQRFDSSSPSILRQDDELTPEELDAFAAVGAEYMASGAKTAEDFRDRLLDEYPDAEPFVAAIFKAATGRFKATATTARTKTPRELLNLTEEGKELSNRMVYNMVRGVLAEGIRERAVLDKVTAMLKEKFPDITREDVVIAFTGYGTIKVPSQEELAKEARELRNAERIQAQIADAKAGRAPKKTGQQRDPATPEIRGLMRQLKDVLRAAGIKHTYGRDQLKGVLDATKTRLKNEIADLDSAIKRKSPIVRKKGKTDTSDPELNTLRDQRKAKQAEYDAVFGINRKAITDGQRIAAMLKMLDKQIAEEEAMERAGILKRPPTVLKTPQTPEILARRKRLAELRKNRHTLAELQNPKKSAEQVAMERLKSSTKRAIERGEYFLENGKYPPNADGTAVTPDQELADLQTTRDAIRDAVDYLREDSLPREPKEQRAIRQQIAQLEKVRDEIERRINARDFSKKAKSPDKDPRITGLRATNKLLRGLLTRMETDGLVPVSVEEKKILSMIKASNTRTEKIKEKIRNRDFRETPKPDPVIDRRLAKARFEENEAKVRFNKMRQQWRLENRGVTGKAWYYTKGLLQLRKIIVLGLELGVIGRQGNILTTSSLVFNQKRLFRVLKGASLAAFSRQDELTMYEAMMERPNAMWDKAAGIKLHAPQSEGYERLNQEDLPDPELLDKLAELTLIGIPFKAVQAIERFTRVFLNVARVEMFDAFISTSRDGNPTLEEVKVYGSAVMNATGRGSFKNSALDTGVALGNTVTISTRWMVSRAKLAVLEPVWTTRGEYRGTLKARGRVLNELYLKTLFARALVLTATSMMFGDDDDEEDKIVMDPRSSKFLTVNYKDVKLDILGGVRQHVNLIARIAMGSRVDASGKVVPIRGEGSNPFSGDTDDEVFNFLRSRVNVNVGLAMDIAKGVFYGDKQVTPSSVAVKLVAPIMVGDTIELFKRYTPAEASALWSLMFTGTTVTPPPQKKPKANTNPATMKFKFE